jgi:type VI secretion system secreted protein Hcp
VRIATFLVTEALLAAPLLALAEPPVRDVTVVNPTSRPVPVVQQGTSAVYGDVNVMNSPTVQQGGPWVVDLNGPVSIASMPPVTGSVAVTSLPPASVTGAVAVTSVPPLSVSSLPELAVRIVGGSAGSGAAAPQSVFLFLKANGRDIKGESSVGTLGRQDAIECLSYTFSVAVAREAATGYVTGRREYQPIVCRKRVDKASPLLLKALTSNEKIDAMFKFYRPNPSGDGTVEQFYTVEIGEGAIVAMDQLRGDLSAGSGAPPLEDVSFVFRSIQWTITNGGITHEDGWSSTK